MNKHRDLPPEGATQNTKIMKFRFLKKVKVWQFVQFAVYFAVLIGAVFYGFRSPRAAQEILRDPKTAAMEDALYARSEFFGADALVPFPTAQARERLAKVLETFPDDPAILLKLAEIDERLERFEDAEQAIKSIKPENLHALADFYGRRAEYEKQAAALERILENSPIDTRAEAFSNLINLAKKHDLKKYLAPEFYRREIARDQGALDVLLAFVEKLSAEKNYAEALKILDETGANFPAAKNRLLEKQIDILILQNNAPEAEGVFRAAFEPFWTDEESEKFYGFLRDNDRYRAYESELRQKFRQNAIDFQTAIRLIHFLRNEGDEFGAIVRKLERERAARKIAWQPDELLTLSQFLIDDGDGEAASRFLYTLCTDFKVKENPELRRKVLYQLFELLSDAGRDRLALTRGNLDFYETVAKSDARPGITTGILSLIFSDTSPRQFFDNRQESAVKLFNRAAAYRIFQEFKKEYPDAPELAQMYLDVVRLYTNFGKPEIAAGVLEEFAQKHSDFKDYPDAALKLSDAFIAAKQFDKEREIYQKLLDFLGRSGQPKFPFASQPESSDLTNIRPAILAYPPRSNEGIDVSPAKQTSFDNYYYKKPSNYRNYLSSEPDEISYADVLARLVASLARENKTQEILNLYAGETAKYADEPRLYEQMLQWLGQTNLAERQFEVYQKALQNFQNRTWKDRFARWLIRHQRREDFDNFSRSIVSNFDDAETQEFLGQFIDGKENGDAKSLDSQMFFALYSLAHRRFPHNIAFVKGLLRYYRQNKMETAWRKLLAEYYFESAEIRREFLADAAKRGELRGLLKNSADLSGKTEIEALPYKLFRADASLWTSDFENSAEFYRELNELYPNDAELAENFLAVSRSLGQTNRRFLLEAADFSGQQADNFPSDETFRVRAGEIQAEIGNYQNARFHWQKIIEQGAGESESYLNTATVFWDYFQFDDALQTIKSLREKAKDENLYAFQAGAILEAKNERRAAVSEYLKALDDNEIDADMAGAKRRLKQLLRKPEIAGEINASFERQRKTAKNPFRMTFIFADALYQNERQEDAVELLARHIKTEKSAENIIEVRRFFRDLDETDAVRATLERLIEISENPRDAIAYRLQLAENFRENYEPEKAATIVAGLVKKFPANYGVLKETETFYWDLGQREKSIDVLQAAVTRARGEYLYRFRRKLAQRLTALNRQPEAEPILLALQTENPDDEEVFAELTDLYVRTNRADALRKAFASTLDALAKQDLEPLDFKWKAENLREKMIDAFTRLKDYDAAAEQYIELINREPESEETVEKAIGFAKRYGGGAKLLDYYRKTARESFKNYRWNVVLARIYEATGDLPNAVENYKTAIFNQPEKLELYESLGEIYVKMQNFEAALENLEKLLELSGEDKKYVKQKAQILEKLGKKTEAEAERAKLPAENLPKPQTLPEQFAEAQKLPLAETEKSIEMYRAAFENLAANPFQNDLKSTEIAGFVQTVHRQDALESITAKLWILREKLDAEIKNPDSVQSGRARSNLKTLDGAFADAVSLEIKTKAIGNEILALRNDIQTRLDATEKTDLQTLSFLQNLSIKCGFDDLLEKILVRNLADADGDDAQLQSLRAILGFYQKRGDHRRVLEILENDLANKSLEFVRIYAQTARILEETEKEQAALALIFSKQTADDDSTRRYLEILYEKNRSELENLARSPSRHALQIINFLLSKKEADLATEAIKNSGFNENWKNMRAAETRLKFDLLTADNETYFTNALRAGSVGEMIVQNPAEPNRLANNDWFNFSDRYGKWLFAASQREKAENYLAAKIENQPKDAHEQFELGYFYLRQKEFARALEHFQIASELSPENKSFRAFTGAAYFQLNEKEKAFENWRQIVEGDENGFENAALYLKTLADFGQTAKARGDLKPQFIEQLKSFDEDDANTDAGKSLKEFTRQLAKSFADDSEKTTFFLEICKAATENTILPQILIDESLIARRDFGAFYRILIERAEGFDDYEHDYKFVSLLETSWEIDEAEALFDVENNFEIDEPKNERLDLEKKYLEYLFETGDFAQAAKLIAEIENSLKGHYPRPVWLRLAEFRVLLKQNKSPLAKMLKFTGIEISPGAQKAVLPNLERLNQAIEILKIDRREDLIRDLQEAFFARQIALGQYNTANFTALARIELQKSNALEALKILKIMTSISSEESQAELDSRPLIARFSNKENLPIEAQNTLDEKDALRQTAEILSEFGFLPEAAVYREKLRVATPNDAVNRMELARLYAAASSLDDAARILLEIIADRNIERRLRWQSLLVLAETGRGDAGFWQKIVNENQTLTEKDAEMRNALSAISEFQIGQTDEALNLLKENDFTPQLGFLKAIFEKRAARDEQALDAFIRLSESSAEIEEAFGFYEPELDFQIINLYLKTGRTRTALYLAQKARILQAAQKTDFLPKAELKFKTLDFRRREMRFVETRQMLEKLSNAAETAGDFSQAAEFEKAKSGYLTTPEEAETSAARIEFLRRKQAFSISDFGFQISD